MNGEGQGGKYFEKGKYSICGGEEKRADLDTDRQNCEESARILDQEFTIEASLTTNPFRKLESPTKQLEWEIVEEQPKEINTWPAVALEGQRRIELLL